MFPKNINNENLIQTQNMCVGKTRAYFLSLKNMVLVLCIGIGTRYRQLLKTRYLYLVGKKWYRDISSFFINGLLNYFLGP